MMDNENKVTQEQIEALESWDEAMKDLETRGEEILRKDLLDRELAQKMEHLDRITTTEELLEMQEQIRELNRPPCPTETSKEMNFGLPDHLREWSERIRQHPMYRDDRIGEWGMKRLDWLLEVAPSFEPIQRQLWDLIFFGKLAAYLNKFDRIMRLRIEHPERWLATYNLPENHPRVWNQIGSDLTLLEIKDPELKADREVLEYAKGEFETYPYLLAKERPIPAEPDDPEEPYELGSVLYEALERAMLNPQYGKRAFKEWAAPGGLIQDHVDSVYLNELENQMEREAEEE